ncbi:SMI1/KNR4 family protein [Acaryochloris sp. IP29b_bin.148]|uniref:SMI1/KNR4 family protein n=1 Tax=Acaryochloris sp. IP29b_bin.148 TaxID=2969218 RepID=UPI002608817E|nr:SMI1/KNR4 family protein [Acaryochloris sp. IP29b_bin.148]
MNFKQEGIDKKWLELFEKLSIVGKPRTSSIGELNEFESRTKVILPQEFKSFCQVFGSVVFKNSQTFIDCPRDDSRDYHEEKMDWRSASLVGLEEGEENHDFLNSSYFFGAGDNHSMLCWDLRTYKASDRSYDIHIYNDIDNKKYRHGRSFFDFIIDICIEVRVPEGVLIGCLHPDDRENMFRCY